jgi:RNA polymerase sigma-70 factor (ECF subfamily)
VPEAVRHPDFSYDDRHQAFSSSEFSASSRSWRLKSSVPVVAKKRTPLTFAARRAQARFDLLLRPHLDHLYRLAYRFTGATDRAEDLIQDLLVRVYPRCEELAVIEQPRPWLTRVMYRIFIDQVRHESRAPHMPIADSRLTNEFADEGDPYAEVADTAPGPEDELAMQFDRERLTRAWEQLNPDQRALLTLFEIEGYTLQELEVMLECTRGTL